MLTPDGAPDSTVTPILSPHLFHCIPSPLHLFLFLCPFTVSSTFLSPPSASLFSLAPSFGFSLCFLALRVGVSCLHELYEGRGVALLWPSWRASWRRLTFQRLFVRGSKQSLVEMWLHLHGLALSFLQASGIMPPWMRGGTRRGPTWMRAATGIPTGPPFSPLARNTVSGSTSTCW